MTNRSKSVKFIITFGVTPEIESRMDTGEICKIPLPTEPRFKIPRFPKASIHAGFHLIHSLNREIFRGMKIREVAVKTLPPGSRFMFPWNGRRGRVVSQNVGSTCVVLEYHEQKSFVPQVGRNAGKQVTIKHSTESTHIAHSTMVVPL